VSVLTAAKSHGVTHDGLANWLRDNGGIEEVRRQIKKSEEAIKNAAALAEAKTAALADIETRRWCNKMSSIPAAPDFLTV